MSYTGFVTLLQITMVVNTTEDVYFNGSVANTSQPAFPSFQRPPSVSIIASIVLAWFTGVTGTCANAVVLAVLVFARRHFGSHVNTLITNQSAIDLAACIFLIIGFGLKLPGTPKYDFGLGQVGNKLVCLLFESRVLAVMCKNAGIIGLVITEQSGRSLARNPNQQPLMWNVYTSYHGTRTKYG